MTGLKPLKPWVMCDSFAAEVCMEQWNPAPPPTHTWYLQSMLTHWQVCTLNTSTMLSNYSKALYIYFFFFKCQIWNCIFVWMTITVIICKCRRCCVGLIWENVVVPSCQCAVFTVFSWQLHTFEEITGLNKWWAARTHVQTMFALISQEEEICFWCSRKPHLHTVNDLHVLKYRTKCAFFKSDGNFS